MMQDRQPEVGFEGSPRPLLAGFLAIQAFLGYEWFMSGLAKALSSDFVSGLGGTLTDTSKDLSGFYKSFLEGIVIPNAQLFAYLVMLGELAIGITLIAVAAVWWFRWSRLSITGRSVLLGLIVLAGAFAIFMNANFHLASGSPHPWFIAADPFGEGVDLDSVMPVIQLAISLVAFVFLRRVRAARPASLKEPSSAPSTARS
jgi:thiosulfate dehydrogenase [quinone] large subunit